MTWSRRARSSATVGWTSPDGSTDALVAASGGGAISLEHPAQRLSREATFYLIQAQTARSAARPRSLEPRVLADRTARGTLRRSGFSCPPPRADTPWMGRGPRGSGVDDDRVVPHPRAPRDGAVDIWAKGWRLESQVPALVPRAHRRRFPVLSVPDAGPCVRRGHAACVLRGSCCGCPAWASGSISRACR